MANFSTRLKELRKQRELSQKEMAAYMGVAQTTIANYEQNIRFPDEAMLNKIADYFNVSMDYLIGRSDVEGAGNVLQKVIIQYLDSNIEDPLTQLAEKYMIELLQGNKMGASRLMLEAARSGTDVRELYLKVFEPCMRRIGKLWELKVVDIAEEHFFTNATQNVMSQLYSFTMNSAKKDYTVVSLAVDGELHNIGIRMVNDFLEMEGWNTYFLEGNVPTPSVVKIVNDLKANVLAISATMESSLDEVRNLIRSVRTTGVSNTKIFVGGGLFNNDKELWKKVGADAYSSDAMEAVEVIRKLFG